MAELWELYPDVYEKPKGRLERWITGPAKTAGSALATAGREIVRDAPNLWRSANDALAGRFGQTVVEDAPWYNRYQYTGDGRSAGQVFRDVPRQALNDLPFAVSMSLGPPGGAVAGALRTTKNMPFLRTGASYLVNRGIPTWIWSDSAERGEYAPGIADLTAYGAMLGVGRLGAYARPHIAPLARNYLPNWATWAGRKAYTPAVLGGSVYTGYKSMDAVAPWANRAGGDIYDMPWQGNRVPGNPNYVFGPDGFTTIYDPPIGVDPAFDAYMRRG
jgi:hypothetical protein